MGSDDPANYYQVPGGLTVATRWQLSRTRGLESCNSQVPGDLRVATLKSPGTCELPSGRHCQADEDLMVAARVVETQRTTLENIGKRAIFAETQGPVDSDNTRMGVDHPGCNFQVPGDLSCNSQDAGDLRDATLKSPGT